MNLNPFKAENTNATGWGKQETQAVQSEPAPATWEKPAEPVATETLAPETATPVAEEQAPACQDAETATCEQAVKPDTARNPYFTRGNFGMDAVGIIEVYDMNFHVGSAFQLICVAADLDATAQAKGKLSKAVWYLERLVKSLGDDESTLACLNYAERMKMYSPFDIIDDLGVGYLVGSAINNIITYTTDGNKREVVQAIQCLNRAVEKGVI